MKESNHAASALFIKAVGLHVSNQFDAAEKLYQQVLAMEPGHYEALNNLGLALLEQGRLAEAGALIRQALQLRPDSADALFNLCKVLIDEGSYELAIARLDQILAQTPADPEANLAMAFAVEQKGAFDDAEEHYHEAAQFSTALGLTRLIAFGREFYELISRPRVPFSQPGVRAELRTGGAKYVVAVSCDMRYFRKYCPTLLASLRGTGDDFLLHLHVIGPDQPFEDGLPALLNNSGLPNMVVSTELIPDYLSGEKDRGTYFACARFLHLSHWLQHYGLPVLAIDADAVVEGPLHDLVTASKEHDVGLYFRHPRRAPWLDICAGAVVANPTADAIDYFAQVAAYIGHHLRHGGAYWHLDQIGLYCTLTMRRRFGGALRVADIKDAADRLLWQIGQSYDHKLLEERYTRHLSPPPAG